MRKFIWTPNFYIILVAPAGIAAKSTSISIGTDLLSKIPADAGIHFGPESMTWQKLADTLAASTEYVKYIGLDAKEGLQTMSALTCAVSELGTFLSMEDDHLLSFLIRMWDGGDTSFIHSTKASGNVEVKSPWLNIIAATTPTWLGQNFPPIMVGGGLASRILFVHGEKKRRPIPYPDEEVKLSEALEMKRKLIEDLGEIAKLSGPYLLLEEARKWGREWYIAAHEGKEPYNRKGKLASEKYDGYFARKQTHVHKVAMIVAASRRDQLFITKDDLMLAYQLVSFLEEDMKKTFDSIGQNDVSRAMKQIKDFIESNGAFIRHDELVSHTSTHIRSWMLKEAIESGLQSGVFVVGKDADGTTTYAMKKRPA